VHQICIFEDGQYSRLTPLVYTRPVFELRCGLFTPLERITQLYPHTPLTIFCRDYLKDILQKKYPDAVNTPQSADDTYLFLNGRAIFTMPVSLEGSDEIGIQDDTLVYVRLRGEYVRKLSHEAFLAGDVIKLLRDRVRVVSTDIPLIHYFWDIMKHNKSQIENDFRIFIKHGSISGKVYEGAYLINAQKIFIGNDTLIKPCCVLDAENGPIYIGNHVTISPNTTIEGPVFIGNHAVVQPNTRLRAGTNVGESCKVGGEISNTIFHSCSNKQHDGFLGDSYIGSWVNIGADTVNSNLLNTYGHIKVEIEGNVINTHHMFLGMAMGDHTKTAINTTIMTGSVFGFACNIITPAYPPKQLPSFTWYSRQGMKVYIPEKALTVAKIAMKRRNREMTPAEEQLFMKVFQLTEKERNTVYGKRYQA
jgi:UDP-N-acetylglucosamine diphosphorylase/glucosamine-1-phosphate N-acetyltransferase